MERKNKERPRELREIDFFLGPGYGNFSLRLGLFKPVTAPGFSFLFPSDFAAGDQFKISRFSYFSQPSFAPRK